MRIFKTNVFSKFAKKEQLSDSALLEAVERHNRCCLGAPYKAENVLYGLAKITKLN